MPNQIKFGSREAKVCLIMDRVYNWIFSLDGVEFLEDVILALSNKSDDVYHDSSFLVDSSPEYYLALQEKSDYDSWIQRYYSIIADVEDFLISPTGKG